MIKDEQVRLGYQQTYRLENVGKLCKRAKQHYQDNKEKVLAYHKTYYEQNKVYISERMQQYYQQNKNKRGKVKVVQGHWRYPGGKSVHCVIAEKVLGRNLRRGEMVHHFDGDGLNNLHKNLLICDRSYHGWFEKKMAALGKLIVFGKQVDGD